MVFSQHFEFLGYRSAKWETSWRSRRARSGRYVQIRFTSKQLSVCGASTIVMMKKELIEHGMDGSPQNSASMQPRPKCRKFEDTWRYHDAYLPCHFSRSQLRSHPYPAEGFDVTRRWMSRYAMNGAVFLWAASESSSASIYLLLHHHTLILYTDRE